MFAGTTKATTPLNTLYDTGDSASTRAAIRKSLHRAEVERLAAHRLVTKLREAEQTDLLGVGGTSPTRRPKSGPAGVRTRNGGIPTTDRDPTERTSFNGLEKPKPGPVEAAKTFSRPNNFVDGLTPTLAVVEHLSRILETTGTKTDAALLEYVKQVGPQVEDALGSALNSVLATKPDARDVVAHVGSLMQYPRTGLLEPTAAAKAAAKEAAAKPKEEEGEEVPPAESAAKEKKGGEKDPFAWNAKSWVRHMEPVVDSIEQAILQPLIAQHKADADAKGHVDLASSEQLSYVQKLATLDGEAGPAAFLELLNEGMVLEKLAEALYKGARELNPETAGGGVITAKSKEAEAQSKFTAEMGTMGFGDQSAFLRGLEALIGPPSVKVFEQMEIEHTGKWDSDKLFETKNYGICSCPAIEWHFVVDPVEYESSGELEKAMHKLDEEHQKRRGEPLIHEHIIQEFGKWPNETRLRNSEVPRDREQLRKIVPLEDYLATMEKDCNAKLTTIGQEPLRKEEVIGARLYTGPMFSTYNTLLRSLGTEYQEAAESAKAEARLAAKYGEHETKEEKPPPSPPPSPPDSLPPSPPPSPPPEEQKPEKPKRGVSFSNAAAEEEADAPAPAALSPRPAPMKRLASSVTNTSLRAAGHLDDEEEPHEINKYTTTIHAINSCVLKMSQLTKAGTVYRGLSGLQLPKKLLEANEYNIRSGVEFGFMSTTEDREVAFNYSTFKGAGLLFEVRMGAMDRGADLSWLSQYPHEKEVLFPPMTLLEVQDCIAEGGTLVVHLNADVNRQCGTLTQVVSKRRKIVTDMSTILHQELTDGIFADKSRWDVIKKVCNNHVTIEAADHLKKLLHGEGGPAAWDAEKYNDGDEMGRAVMLAVKSTKMVNGWPDGINALITYAKEKKLDGAEEDDVEKMVEAISNETELKFEGKPLEDSGISALSLAMNEYGKSRASVLELKKMKITEVGGCDLFASISEGSFPNLTKLILDHNNGLGIRAATRLGAVMAEGQLSNLEVLWLNDCSGLGDDGCAQIFGSLTSCPKMKELCANGVGLGKKSIDALCAAIEKGALSNLTTRLNLINNIGINDDCVIDLAKALGANPAGKSIPRLQLEGCAVTDKGLKALMEEVESGNLPELKQLEIHMNKKITDDAMKAAAKVAVEKGFKEKGGFKVGMVAFEQAFTLAKAAAQAGV